MAVAVADMAKKPLQAVPRLYPNFIGHIGHHGPLCTTMSMRILRSHVLVVLISTELALSAPRRSVAGPGGSAVLFSTPRNLVV